MDKEQMMKTIAVNEELKEQIFRIKTEAENEGKTPEEYAELVLPILKKADIDVTKQDIIDMMVLENSKLTESDLEKISGGGLCCDYTYRCSPYFPCNGNCDH